MEEYLPKYRNGAEGIVVNLSSIAGLDVFPSMPVYSASKSAIISFGRSLGADIWYEKFRVKILTICPGVTTTKILERAFDTMDEPTREIAMQLPQQTPEKLAELITEVIRKSSSGSVWVCEAGKKPYEMKFNSRITSQFD